MAESPSNALESGLETSSEDELLVPPVKELIDTSLETKYPPIS